MRPRSPRHRSGRFRVHRAFLWLSALMTIATIYCVVFAGCVSLCPNARGHPRLFLGTFRGAVVGTWVETGEENPVVDFEGHFGIDFVPHLSVWTNPSMVNVGMPLIYLLAASVALAWFTHQRFRARMKGCCHACGYDLRGISTTVCPECGSGIESSASGS